MPKRGREKDEYPEFIRERIVMPVITTVSATCVTGAVVLQDWVLPVELDLNQPTFIELNKFVVWIESPFSTNDASGSGIGGELALQRQVDVFIMNERRTAVPSGDDNAIMMHCRLTMHQEWAVTASSSANCGVINHAKSNIREERNYEDAKTGQGLLIAQPRIFLLAVETMAEGTEDLGVHTATRVNFKMEFRLTDKVSSKEFFTEMIAKFS